MGSFTLWGACRAHRPRCAIPPPFGTAGYGCGNVHSQPNRRGRRPRRPFRRRLGRLWMVAETCVTRCRGGCPHPPSRRQARNGGEDGWGWYNLRFRKPPRKGGRGRPPLQRGRAGCEIAAERIRIVTNDMQRRQGVLYLYPRFPPSDGRVVEDADPYGWCAYNLYAGQPPAPSPGGLRYSCPTRSPALSAATRRRIVSGHSPPAPLLGSSGSGFPRNLRRTGPLRWRRTGSCLRRGRSRSR